MADDGKWEVVKASKGKHHPRKDPERKKKAAQKAVEQKNAAEAQVPVSAALALALAPRQKGLQRVNEKGTFSVGVDLPAKVLKNIARDEAARKGDRRRGRDEKKKKKKKAQEGAGAEDLESEAEEMGGERAAKVAEALEKVTGDRVASELAAVVAAYRESGEAWPMMVLEAEASWLGQLGPLCSASHPLASLREEPRHALVVFLRDRVPSVFRAPHVAFLLAEKASAAVQMQLQLAALAWADATLATLAEWPHSTPLFSLTLAALLASGNSKTAHRAAHLWLERFVAGARTPEHLVGLEHVQRFADARLSVEAARQIHAEQNHVASVGLRLAPLPEVFAVFFSKREKTDQDEEDDEDDDDEEGEGETLSVLTRILKLEPASTAAKWKTLIASPLTVRLLQHLATLPPSSLPSREALSPFLEFVRESPKASAEAKEAAEALHKKVNAMGWLTIVGGVLGAAALGGVAFAKYSGVFEKGKKRTRR